jgi:hypothetical protein
MRSLLMHNSYPVPVLFKAYRVLNFNTAGVIRKEDPTWDGGGGGLEVDEKSESGRHTCPPPPTVHYSDTFPLYLCGVPQLALLFSNAVCLKLLG